MDSRWNNKKLDLVFLAITQTLRRPNERDKIMRYNI